MNNLSISLKKFVTNKNTVTIIGVLAILIILYFMYTKTIDDKIKEVNVPVAARTINPQTEITAEDVTDIQIASAAKPDDSKIETIKTNIIGKYTGVGSTIPEGSMFYKSMIVEKEELPGNWIKTLAEGLIPYQFSVSTETTYGNGILPGDYVDIYVKTTNEKNELIFGKMIENAQVVSVTDSEGNDVFKSQSDIGTPAFLNFGLTNDYFDVLKKAQYITSQSIELIVVPHGGMVPEEKLEIRVTAQVLRDLITKLAVEVQQDQVQTPANNTNNANGDSNSNSTEEVIVP